MTDREKSEWDQAVAEYDCCYVVMPKGTHSKKYSCHPIRWAAKKLDAHLRYHTPDARSKHGHKPRRVGRDPVKKRANNRRWLAKPGNKLKSANARRICDAERCMTPEGKMIKNLKKVPQRAMCDSKKGWRTHNRKLCLPDGMTITNWMVSQFSSKMTLENYGTYWVIDHYYPVAKIDRDDPAHVAAVCDYRNLRPMTKDGNARKKDRVYLKAQALFDELVAEKRFEGS
jgi:hypothetical protein